MIVILKLRNWSTGYYIPLVDSTKQMGNAAAVLGLIGGMAALGGGLEVYRPWRIMP